MKLFQIIRQRGVVCLWYKFKRTFIKPDKDILEIGARNGSYDYLQRYASACGTSTKDMAPGKKIIWVCWLQGFENAPRLVQVCLNSIKKHKGEYRVVELTEKNIPQYVTLPDFIWDKYHKGIISRTHFSDAMRFSLLSEHGGIWVDATTLMTGALPTFAIDTPLFVYHSDQKGSSLLSVNFISCCKHHPLVEDTYRMIEAYWKAENRTVDYNMTAVFWTIAVRANQQNSELWKQVLYVPTGLKEVLINELNTPYTEKRWRQICALSPIHKLTYKFDEFGVNPLLKESLFDYIMNTPDHLN